MKLFFVFNPKAGQVKIKQRLGDIIELFSVKNHTVTVRATTKRGDATELIRKLEDGYDRVICAGGDGTLDEVVEGMAQREHKLPIGYIPAGSTNDYASSLGIPTSVLDAARVAIGPHIFSSDVGDYNGKSFVYVAAFGAFTEVSYATPQDLKNRLGHGAYIVTALKYLADIKPYHMKVYANGNVIESEFIYGMVTNSNSVGGVKNITGPDITLNDGLFEVTLVTNPKNPAELNSIISALMNRNLTSKNLYSFKISEIEFEADEEVPWTIDGEFAGNDRIVKIKNRKQELMLSVKKTL